MQYQQLALTAAAAVMLAACNRSAPPTPAPAAAPVAVIAAPAPAAKSPAEQWLGQWVGPEGTLLALSKNAEGYEVKIQSLDGPNTYQGRAVTDHIEFERNGTTESIHAGTGADTGMKWLAEKKDCLVIRQSEGFCRD